MKKDNTKKDKESTPEELMNEGLGNKQKFQSENFRKGIEGEINDEDIETIEKAEEKKKV
jgi:hypothetical protein